MDLTGKRKLAASLLKCGVGRVWIDPDRVEEVMDATTRADIRNLIRDGAIRKLQKRGVSRVRARHREQQKKKGRRRGVGSRKGAAKARLSKKSRWMTKIRAQRRLLRELREKGEITKSTYRRLYRQASGGMFKSKAHILSQLEAGKKK